jgi:hypothetical protein
MYICDEKHTGETFYFPLVWRWQDYNSIKGKMEKKAEEFKEFERQETLSAPENLGGWPTCCPISTRFPFVHESEIVASCVLKSLWHVKTRYCRWVLKLTPPDFDGLIWCALCCLPLCCFSLRISIWVNYNDLTVLPNPGMMVRLRGLSQ